MGLGHLAHISVLCLCFLLRGCEMFCQHGRPATAPNNPTHRGRLVRCVHGDRFKRPCNVLCFGMFATHDDFNIALPAARAPLLSTDFSQLPRSKTDASTGVRMIARTNTPLCAVSAFARLTDYTRAYSDPGVGPVGAADGPRDRAAVPVASSTDTYHHSAHQLVHVYNAVAAELGYDIHITTHSFRATGATWMAARGCSAAQIKHWGRWASDAYLVYLRASTEEAMAVANAFAIPDAVLLQLPTAATLLSRLGGAPAVWGVTRRMYFTGRHAFLPPDAP